MNVKIHASFFYAVADKRSQNINKINDFKKRKKLFDISCIKQIVIRKEVERLEEKRQMELKK